MLCLTWHIHSPHPLQTCWWPCRNKLYWDPPEDDGGRKIFQYKLYRGLRNGRRESVVWDESPWAITPDARNVLIVDGLLRDTTYYWRLTSINIVGEGPPSDSRSSTTDDIPDTINWAYLANASQSSRQLLTQDNTLKYGDASFAVNDLTNPDFEMGEVCS